MWEDSLIRALRTDPRPTCVTASVTAQGSCCSHDRDGSFLPQGLSTGGGGTTHQEAISADVLSFHSFGGWALLSSSGQSPERLLNIPHGQDDPTGGDDDLAPSATSAEADKPWSSL